MEYRTLGSSGLKVSRLVLGTLTVGNHEVFRPAAGLDLEAFRRLFDISLDAGVNMVDTADIYSFGEAEEVVGHLLKGRRDDVLVASKVRMRFGDGPNNSGASALRVIGGIDDSLRRLQTDHLDLLYVHQWDGETPIEETLAALDRLVDAGKVRYIGISNFNGWQTVKAVEAARRAGLTAPIVNQVYYTPEARESEYEIIPAALDQGVGILAWSPLGQGLLGGKVRRGQDIPQTTRQGTGWPEPHVIDRERAYDIIELLHEIAVARGVSIPQVVLAWLLQRPGITGLVIGARDEQQLRDNLASVEVSLTDEETRRLDAATQPPAIYPYWHRVMTAAERPDPAEEPFLSGYRSTLGS